MVIFSQDVTRKIEEYANALASYPISSQRAINKVENLRRTLLSLDSFVRRLPICMYKDLGQRFNNKPFFSNLKRYNYKDKSGFQWAFACHCDYVQV